jgi:hypothetical protein
MKSEFAENYRQLLGRWKSMIFLFMTKIPSESRPVR